MFRSPSKRSYENASNGDGFARKLRPFHDRARKLINSEILIHMVLKKSDDSETNRAVVFFSYSWDDKSHRKAIGAELAVRFGIRVKFDQDEDQNLPVPLIIKTIVEEADALIVLISKDSMKSRYVIEELVRCHERGVRFIPIYLEEVDKRLILNFLQTYPRFDSIHEVSLEVASKKSKSD